MTLRSAYGWKPNYIPVGESQTFAVPAFTIAKYPVTNGQYRKFMDARGYQHERWWTAAGWQFRQRDQWTKPFDWKHQHKNGDDCPVVGVSWFEAVAFCLWLSERSGEPIRLPTEQEWQRAAQALPDGSDSGYDYPWGSHWDGNNCNNSVKPHQNHQPTPVTQYQGRGDSPCGVVDLGGNEWEWCLTDHETGEHDLHKSANRRVVRGGSCYDTAVYYFYCTCRPGFEPDYKGGGFRLARSAWR